MLVDYPILISGNWNRIDLEDNYEHTYFIGRGPKNASLKSGYILIKEKSVSNISNNCVPSLAGVTDRLLKPCSGFTLVYSTDPFCVLKK